MPSLLLIKIFIFSRKCAAAMTPAKEQYLKEAPPLYTSSLHNTLVERAVKVFRAAAWGPATSLHEKKLRDDCSQVWKARAQCDAESLNGFPCIHPRHALPHESPLSSTPTLAIVCISISLYYNSNRMLNYRHHSDDAFFDVQGSPCMQLWQEQTST